MTTFYYIILKAIDGYKTILKKNLGAAGCTAKLRQLGINRMKLRNASEVHLYEVGIQIVNEIERHRGVVTRGRSGNFYYGEYEYLQYLKKVLAEYVVENDRVINIVQKSSCALVTAIQLVNMAKEKLSDEVAQQLYDCSRIIIRNGNDEQKQLFNSIISSNRPRHMKFFFRQLQSFISYLAEM